MMLSIAALLCCAGFACLALAMPEHWTRAGASGPAPRALRPAGCAQLLAACALCLWAEGPGFGILLWCLDLSAGAIAVALTLAWRPHWLLLRRR